MWNVFLVAIPRSLSFSIGICSWWFILLTRLYIIYISIYMPRFFIWLYLSEERVFRNTFVDFRKKYSMNPIDRDEFTTKLSKSGRFTLDAKFYRKPEIFSVWFRLILAMKQRWLDGKNSWISNIEIYFNWFIGSEKIMNNE